MIKLVAAYAVSTVAAVLHASAALTGAPLPSPLGMQLLTYTFIGLVIPLAQVALPGSPGWALGLGLGLLFSLPAAIVTKAYAPIIIIGTIGGAVIGWLT